MCYMPADHGVHMLNNFLLMFSVCHVDVSGPMKLTWKEILDLPCKLDEHYIVKDQVHHFRCQKCQQVGQVSDIRSGPCPGAKDVVDSSTKSVDPADKAKTETCEPRTATASSSVGGSGASGSNGMDDLEKALQAEIDQCEAMELMMAELEELELHEQALQLQLEEEELQRALALSMETAPGRIHVPFDPEKADLQKALELSLEKLPVENPLDASKNGASSMLETHAGHPLPPRPKKKKAADPENPFLLPPDKDQRTLFDLKGVKFARKPFAQEKVSSSTKTISILPALTGVGAAL